MSQQSWLIFFALNAASLDAFMPNVLRARVADVTPHSQVKGPLLDLCKTRREGPLATDESEENCASAEGH